MAVEVTGLISVFTWFMYEITEAEDLAATLNKQWYSASIRLRKGSVYTQIATIKLPA